MSKTAVALAGIIVLSAGILAAWGAPQAEDPAVLLRAAIEKEEVDGNLAAAIEQYKHVIKIAGTNRGVAAQALLRLGGCYEKRGPEEARRTYEQLIRDYGEQAREVAAARQRLAALKTSLAAASSLPALRLVWEGTEVELMGAPSPEGRYISFTDWDTGDLAIHDLTTGQNRRLTGQKAWDGNFAENSRWSPDGRLIAFTWASVGTTADVRLVGLDGAKPRILYHQNKEYPWATVEDWSPDGRQILARLYPEGPGPRASVLALISTFDGSVRHLKEIDRSEDYYRYTKFSPDGKYLAFDSLNASPSSLEKDIVLLSIDGKTETSVVKHPANDYLLGWTPDGSSILFASDRTGAIDAWVQPVAGGRVAGEPRIVRKDIGAISPLGFTRDGAFFYGHGKDLRNIYVATVDRTKQAMAATYRKLELPFEGRNDTAEFSPDGRRLAFVRANRKAGVTGPGAIWSNSLCVRSLDTGEEKTFPLNLQTGSLRWAPDSSSILVGGFREMKSFVGNFDVETGRTKELFPTDTDVRQELHLSPDWSPDGRIVYCVVCRGSGAQAACSIVAKDLQIDQTRVVHTESGGLPVISVSPDGTSLAVYELALGDNKGGARRGVLKVVSTRDGAVRELSEFMNATNGLVMPRWSRDGRYVMFAARRAGEETPDVWYVPAEGGTPAKLGLSLRGMSDISPHPDGVRIAFSSLGPTIHGPEVWVMENFLPAVKNGR